MLTSRHGNSHARHCFLSGKEALLPIVSLYPGPGYSKGGQLYPVDKSLSSG